MGDRVERRPDVSRLALSWSIILPAKSSVFQFVRECAEIEAGIFRCNLALVIHHLHRGILGRVTAPTPRGLIWVIDGSSGLGADRIKMIGEAGPGQGREEFVRQNKVAGISK